MSYGASSALQSAVFQKLTSDPTLSGLVGTDIFDALPNGTLPETYVLLGGEVVVDASDGTGDGAWTTSFSAPAWMPPNPLFPEKPHGSSEWQRSVG